MPDNQRTMQYTFQTSFDPKGVKAAVKGVDQMSDAFTTLGSQLEKTNFGHALESMQQFSGALPGVSEQGAAAAKGIVDLTKAGMGLRHELVAVELGTELLQEQFKHGLIDKSAFKEGMASYRALREELQGMTVETYKNRQVYREAMVESTRLADVSRKELEQMGIPMRLFRESVSGTMVDVGKLHNKIRVWGRDPAPKEINRYAELYNNVLRQQLLVQDEVQQSREKLNKAMTFKGAAGAAAANLKEAVVRPFQDAYQWATKIPARLSEGLKEGISGAFSNSGFVSGALGKLFNKKTIMKTMAFGPLGLMSGLMGKKPDREQAGFVSGGEGPLGALSKSLGSFGGILKLAVGALSPMYLLMKALTPVLQTLQWVLEPLMAPIQQLLSDAVMQLVPFISEIAGQFAELANDLLPPLMDMVKTIGPVLVDITRVVLPPLARMLKMTIGWITKVTSVILKALVPVLGWVAEKVAWLAEAIMGSLNWLGRTLLDLPVIGWALKKLGISAETFTPAQKSGGGATPGEASPGQAAVSIPGVNTQGAGVAGEARAMTITEAGGGRAFREFTEPRGVTQPIIYSGPDGQMQTAADQKAEALRSAMSERPELLGQQDPEELSEPVVRALKVMTNALLAYLPKRIGQETKSVTLADFSAVTA